MAEISLAWEDEMTHFPELLMIVMTAVPSKVAAARRWAVGSKSFTEISMQDSTVSLSNGRLQICCCGIWWGRGKDEHSLRKAWRNDVHGLEICLLHTCSTAGLRLGEEAAVIPPEGTMNKSKTHYVHGGSQWEVRSGGIHDKLPNAMSCQLWVW